MRWFGVAGVTISQWCKRKSQVFGWHTAQMGRNLLILICEAWLVVLQIDSMSSSNHNIISQTWLLLLQIFFIQVVLYNSSICSLFYDILANSMHVDVIMYSSFWANGIAIAFDVLYMLTIFNLFSHTRSCLEFNGNLRHGLEMLNF